MPTQTDVPPDGRPVFDRLTRDWVIYHDGQPVAFASWPSEAQRRYAHFLSDQDSHGGAWRFQEPDAVSGREAMAADRLLLDDPLTLYMPGGPQPDRSATTSALDQALAHFSAVYPQPKIQQRALRARTILADPTRWTVRPDGTMAIIGSTTYIVGDEGCTTARGRPCPDQLFRASSDAGGQCKHQIARELLRLAQIFTARQTEPADPLRAPDTAPAPDAAARADQQYHRQHLPPTAAAVSVADPTASIIIAPELLAAAWGFVYLSAEPTVTMTVTSSHLEMLAGPHRLLIAGSDGGDGCYSAVLSRSDIEAVWPQLRTLVKELTDDVTVVVMIDPGVSTLAVLSTTGTSMLISYG